MNYLTSSFDFKKLPEVFDELPLWSAPFGLQLLEQIPYKSGISALDIGCGTGFPLTELALRLGPDSTVYGLDPWEAALKWVEKKLDYYGISNVTLLQGEAEQIPLADELIDLITSNNGINNVKDIPQVLSECHRVLKEGGTLVQTMNLEETMLEFYQELEAVLLEKRLLDAVKKMEAHIAHKRPPLPGFLDLMAEKGFDIVRQEFHKFQYRFADGSAFFRHYFIRLAFMDSWVALVPETETVSIFQAVEKRLNQLAQKNGHLELGVPFVTLVARKK